MKLTIIGCSAAAPSPLGPASGYLIEAEATTLVDIGPGILHELMRQGKDHLDGLIVSHRHADHSLDLMTLAYRRTFPTVEPQLPLTVPTGFSELIDEFDHVYGIPTLETMANPIRLACDVNEIVPGSSFEQNGLAVDTVGAIHPVPTLAMRFPDLGLFYTADTAFSEDILEGARGMDVLLSEATYLHSDGIDVSSHGHLTGRQAGELAAEAGVKRLVITHLADHRQADAIIDEAREVFSGQIDLARPGLEIPLG